AVLRAGGERRHRPGAAGGAARVDRPLHRAMARLPAATARMSEALGSEPVPAEVRRTLVVTNDFPPRQGGIQSFVHEMARRQPPGSIVVYASDHPGSARFDAAQPFPVLRHPTGLLIPTPAAQARVVSAFREFGCRAVWFGA